MKKVKSTLALTMLAVTAGALSSCGTKAHDMNFWSCFGSSYTSALDNIVSKVNDKLGIDLGHSSKGSYDKVKSEMMSSLTDGSYPDIVAGYPDHFAEYIANDILVPLDDYVERYDSEHGTKLLDDYMSQYMAENYDLNIDDSGKKVLSGLPFNKSTELMGYNGTFVDYCATIDASLAEVPSTWQEWEVKGPKYRAILDTLAGTGNHDGKYVYGRQQVDGTAYDFSLENSYVGATDKDGRLALLDFVDVDKELTRVISWDSTDNMFITLVRQWGAEYTRLTDEQKKQIPMFRKGDIMFYSSENRSKVIECLKFFKNLNAQHIFGVPKEFQQSYSSKAFEVNQVMFMLCSSGGLSYNTAKWENRFRVHALPYYDDGVDTTGMSKDEALKHQRKYVISQGADITLTDAIYIKESKKPQEERKTAAQIDDYLYQCFEAMVEMTTGDLQAEWCLQTGYYPCSKSASEQSASYQEFLNEAKDSGINKYMEEYGVSREEALAHAYETPTRVAYREGSEVNQNEYMDDAKHWEKFVDPAFIGSSTIRTVIKTIFESVFIKLTKDSTDADYDKILKDVVNDPQIKQRATNINVVL